MEREEREEELRSGWKKMILNNAGLRGASYPRLSPINIKLEEIGEGKLRFIAERHFSLLAPVGGHAFLAWRGIEFSLALSEPEMEHHDSLPEMHLL